MENYLIIFAAFILGIIVCVFICKHDKKDIHGVLEVDTSNELKDKYNFIITIPIDDVPNQKFLRIKVVNKTKTES